MIRDPLALLALIVAVTALAFWLSRRFRWASRVGATLLVIVFGAVLSNFGWVAAESPVYGWLSGPVTSLAIVWLLLAVDLRDLRIAGPRMLGAFGLGVLGTMAGAALAFVLFGGRFPEQGWKLAGVMTGTYSGGGLNFVAVGRELELPEALFAAATASDNVMTALWMGATLLLPVWLGRFYPAPEPPSAATARQVSDPMHGAARLGAFDLALLVALGLGVMLAAERAAATVPSLPAVIWLTTFALAVAQLPPVRRLQGALQLGTLALHFFFVVLGIGSRVAEILEVGLEVFWFTAVVVAVHGLVLFTAARLCRLDVETTAIASQASVGGPSTALALAVARRRADLALPGAMAGLLGYAVGTYAGLGMAALLR